MPAPASGTYTRGRSPATVGLNAPMPVFAYTPVGGANEGAGEAPPPGARGDVLGDGEEPGPAPAFRSSRRTTRAPSASARIIATTSIALGKDGVWRPAAMKVPMIPCRPAFWRL